jgi:AraC-like DNA-binding protein
LTFVTHPAGSHVARRQPRSLLPAFVSRQVESARRYFLDLRPAAGRPLTVVCGGVELVRGDYHVARDDFPYYCVEFVASGRGTLRLGQREEPLAAGSVFAYGPGIEHEIRTDPRRRLRKYYVDFVGRAGLDSLRSARLAPGSHLGVSHAREIRAVFDLLQQCGLAQSAHCQSLCGQLLGVLLTKIAERSLPTDGSDLGARETFERFRQFLIAARQRLVSVEMAAHEFGISTAYACRLFRRFGAASPYQYLLRQRMNLAADLLTHERLQVKQAAARLGFADQYQFSRAFKRVAGISPQAFQRRQ